MRRRLKSKAVELPFDRALLERWRPTVHYDPQDPYVAVSARSMTDAACNVLVAEDGAVIARGGDGLTLDLLAAYPPCSTPSRHDRIVQGPDRVGTARRFQRDPAYANVVYGRIARHDDMTWLQYWFWYYHNPKELLGLGAHEGDWELVQIGLGDDDGPRLITCSQHTHGEARDYGDHELELVDGAEHPVAYAAPFSHAMYFEAGAHPYLVGVDNPDGSQPSLLPEIEELGSWRDWPGRWGDSKAITRIGRRGAGSPPSPAHQGRRWDEPAAYHRASRRPLARFVAAQAHAVGARTYPRLAGASARRSGETVHVGYEVGPGPKAKYLYVTLHRAEPREVVLSTVAKITQRAGEICLHLPVPVEGELVAGVSLFNRLRQRSDPQEPEILV